MILVLIRNGNNSKMKAMMSGWVNVSQIINFLGGDTRRNKVTIQHSNINIDDDNNNNNKRPSLLAGFLNYIMCPHSSHVDNFLLVG